MLCSIAFADDYFLGGMLKNRANSSFAIERCGTMEGSITGSAPERGTLQEFDHALGVRSRNDGKNGRRTRLLFHSDRLPHCSQREALELVQPQPCADPG